MTRRYLRKIKVQVGDSSEASVIEDLFIKFRIKKQSTNTPADGEIEIYNLNEMNETRIRERGKKVVLEAGYEETLEKIFDGDVRRVSRERAELDRITVVHVGGNQTRLTHSTFIRTYQGPVSVRDIVKDGVENLGFTLGPVELIPADAIENDFRYSGSTRNMLTQRLRPLGVEWFEEDGVVRFTTIKKSGDDRPQGVIISETTGMIGTPTVTDDGVRVSTMLDARLKLDTKIRIETTAPEIDSGDIYKVIEVIHSGDNRGGEYSTTIEARPLE